MSEAELIRDLRSGSESAFRELVAQYQDKVYNTVLGFVQQVEEAQDITQEVFIKVFRSIGSYRGEAALGTWIYRIAVSRSLDGLRKRKRMKSNSILSWFSTSGLSEEPDFVHPGVVAEQKENSVMLFRAIGSLPDNQKTAFLLQKLEGLRQDEIAAIMNTSASAVESLLHRAKQNLRKTLSNYYLNE